MGAGGSGWTKVLMGFLIVFATLFAGEANAGFRGWNGAQDLKNYSGFQCAATGGLTCAKGTNGRMAVSLNTAVTSAAQKTRYTFGWVPSALSAVATDTTPVVGTVFLTQVHLPSNIVITGIQLLNGSVAATDKYIAVLYNTSGQVVANSAVAGVTATGVNSYQQLPFTAPLTLTAGSTYWIGLHVNGTTTRFQTIPAVGAIGGLAGSVTGATFGTVATITVPTTFTANVGPVVGTY